MKIPAKVQAVLPFLVIQLLSVIFILVFLGLAGINQEAEFAITIVFAVVMLMVTLFALTGGFAQMNLTDSRYALGLPEGSIRAMIALILLLVFVMFGTFLYRQQATNMEYTDTIEMPRDAWVNMEGVFSAVPIEEGSDRYHVTFLRGPGEESSRLAQQLLTTVGTLVVAVAGFYFGSATVAQGIAAGRNGGVTDPPVVDSVEPPSNPAGTTPVRFTIRGQNFRGAPVVRLERNDQALTGTVIETTPTMITAEIVPDSTSFGAWDLVVANADGTQVRMPQAFQLRAPGV
jgi:hypothetical protein